MSSFFRSDKPVFSASAPGRLDVMGGIADYSGSLLLQMPIRERTTVDVQEREDGLLLAQTYQGRGKWGSFSCPMELLATTAYREAGKAIKQLPGGDWGVYVAGSVAVLLQEKQLPVKGLSLRIMSEVPEGKGVSSSAAIEVAIMAALKKMVGLPFHGTELPVLAQRAENEVVGAPCGLMDQLATSLGEKNRLLPLVCQPLAVEAPIKIPAGIQFCAIDSGIRHAVSGASYSDVRAAAFMAYTIIALESGADRSSLKQALQSRDFSQLPFKGYLANIPPALFRQRYLSVLPEYLSGADFIAHFGVSIDPVTRIDPEKIYRLRACATHPVEENFRITLFRQLLENFSRFPNKEAVLVQLGELMLQSHAGYSSVGLGNDHTDDLVQRVRAAGTASGLYGARITGGGSGGTVGILCYGKEGKAAAKQLHQEYQQRHRMKTFFFTGSSHGALHEAV